MEITMRSLFAAVLAALTLTGGASLAEAATGRELGGSGSTGMASYYGGRFHGRRTASGVRFDSNGMTAAHRSLPFGTRVRVTHLGSGRSVVVRVNDRGPYVGGRIIDLSSGAAGVLGMHGQGVARVRVTVLGR
jgi:rare lipoprotein A